MPVVHLVRHGQASFGSQDYDRLSDLGRAQSLVVGAALTARGRRSPVAVRGSLRPAFSGGAVAALTALDLPAGQDAVVFTSGAVTKLAVGGRGTTLVTFNEHSHLDPASTTYR